MAKPPIPAPPPPVGAPPWFMSNAWPQHLLSWQYTWATNAARIGCRVYASANQAITTATFTSLAFDSEEWDYGGLHDTVVNNTRVTIQAGQSVGVYLIQGECPYQAAAVGTRFLSVLKNGATRYLMSNAVTANPDSNHLNGTAVLQLAAGDYVELQTFQNSGGNVNVVGGLGFAALAVVRIW